MGIPQGAEGVLLRHTRAISFRNSPDFSLIQDFARNSLLASPGKMARLKLYLAFLFCVG